MHLILYQPGAAGDMVAAVIDSKDFRLIEGRILPAEARMKTTPKDYEELDMRMSIWESKYNAVATQYYEYHIDRRHEYILIDTTYDPRIVEWCLYRAEKVSQPFHAYDHRQASYNHKQLTKAKKHTNKIIKFEDIINGNLITILKQWIDTPLNEELYHQWLKTALDVFPFELSQYNNTIFYNKQNIVGHWHPS